MATSMSLQPSVSSTPRGIDTARAQPCQAPIFTPVRCSRVLRSPILGGSTSHQRLRRHQSIGLNPCHLQPCRSTAADAVHIQPVESEGRKLADVLGVLQSCRNAFVCMAACAIWGYLSSGAGSALPFASMTLMAAENTLPGAQTAVKSAWTGLAAGVLHTLCGPDHLAALTPLTIGRNRVAASALGALWGFGHSTGQLILGLIMVLLKDRFHDFLPALEKWSGLVVAATLIAIGVMGIYESYFEKADQAAEHVEDEQEVIKLALAGGGSVPATSAKGSIKASFATYATGIVYGLQPDALFVVVPALALPTKAAAIAYCTMFVFGTVMAMGGYTLLIGTTSAALTKERPWLQAHLSTVASGIAILVGVLMGLAGLGFDVPFFA